MRSLAVIAAVAVAAVVLAAFVFFRSVKETGGPPPPPVEGVPAPGSVAATVNGEKILWDELLGEILRIYRVEAGAILNQQIMDRIAAQEAKKQGVAITDQEVEASLQEQNEKLLAQSNGTVTLQKLCERTGQSMDEIRRELRKQLVFERLLREEKRIQGPITDKAIRKWLDERKARASIRTAAGGLPPHVAAVVNGEEIPKALVVSELLGRMSHSAIEAILDDLITGRLLQQKLRERGLRVTDDEVESMIQTKREMIRQDPRYYRQTLDQALKSQGKTLKDLENHLRQNIALVKLFEKEIPEKDLRKLFEDSKDALSGKRVRASHIVAMTIHPKTKKPLGPSADIRARKKIEHIRKLLDSGARFEDMARKYSDDPPSARKGGDLGFFRKRGDVVAQVADAAFDMKKGEIRSPVKSTYGYHIVKVTDIDPGKSISFSTERFTLLVQYVSQKSNRTLREKWIERLRKEAKIKTFIAGIGRKIQPAEQAKEKKASQ
ncbi:MAG: hypothetical protein GXP25_07865 [Planctomycetes bacterium]|nr:hypothetical protein [Planctomycetota bacterium]